ncbi:MAG: biliverdin-producing heme oxygenase [Prochlorococcaceae cyanobacterium]
MVAAPSISDHATAADQLRHRGFGPRVRRLHARIGKAHHQAEGMAFSRALLAGEATPLQLAALIRALAPAYALLEREAPLQAAALGALSLPWSDLARRAALEHDCALLAGLPATPPSAAAAAWMGRLQELVRTAPHRLMAHVYVRYGGDLSGGQQLGVQARRILAAQGLPALSFWKFSADLGELKQQLHQGFEELDLSPAEEEELLEECELAFQATQRLLAELATLA